jgi:hypothetical protein
MNSSIFWYQNIVLNPSETAACLPSLSACLSPSMFKFFMEDIYVPISVTHLLGQCDMDQSQQSFCALFIAAA